MVKRETQSKSEVGSEIKSENDFLKKQKYSFDISEDIKFREGSILSKVLSKSERYDVTLMCMAKGTSINTHISTRQGFISVLRGSGEFVLSDEHIQMKQDVFIVMPPDAPHSLRADGNLAILLILTK